MVQAAAFSSFPVAPSARSYTKVSLLSERSISSMAYPANYRYTREHEWISLDGKIGHSRHHRLRAELAWRHRLRRCAQGGRHRDRQRVIRVGRERKGGQRSVLACHRHGDGGERGTEDRARQDQRGAARNLDIKVELPIRRSSKSCSTPRRTRSLFRKRPGLSPVHSCQFSVISEEMRLHSDGEPEERLTTDH